MPPFVGVHGLGRHHYVTVSYPLPPPPFVRVDFRVYPTRICRVYGGEEGGIK